MVKTRPVLNKWLHENPNKFLQWFRSNMIGYFAREIENFHSTKICVQKDKKNIFHEEAHHGETLDYRSKCISNSLLCIKRYDISDLSYTLHYWWITVTKVYSHAALPSHRIRFVGISRNLHISQGKLLFYNGILNFSKTKEINLFNGTQYNKSHAMLA